MFCHLPLTFHLMIQFILRIGKKLIRSKESKKVLSWYYYYNFFPNYFRCAMGVMTAVTCRMNSQDALVSFSKNFNFNFQRNRGPSFKLIRKCSKTLLCLAHLALTSIKNIEGVAFPKLFPSSKLSILRACKNSHILRTILWSIIIKVLRDEAWPSLASAI